MRFDTFIAVLCVVAASIVSYRAYGALLAVEQPQQVLLQSIPVGERHFALLGGESCAGVLDSTLQLHPETTLISHGDFSIRYQGRTLNIKLFLGAYFNALQQLVLSNFNIEAEHFKLSAKLINPNPIQIDIQLDDNGGSLNRRFSAPGPLMLRPNEDGSYRLDYQALERFGAGLLPSSFQLPADKDPFSGFSFRLVPYTQLPAECRFSEASGKMLEVDPLIEKALSLAPGMRMIFNSFQAEHIS
jgi:hypothetical protein